MCFFGRKKKKAKEAEQKRIAEEKAIEEAKQKKLEEEEKAKKESKAKSKPAEKKVQNKEKAEPKKTVKKETKTEEVVEVKQEPKQEDIEEVNVEVQEKTRKAVYRVIFDKEDRLWKIKKDGAKRVIDSKVTKEEALARVQELSESHDFKFVVYKKDGKFQKKANLNLKSTDKGEN